MSSFEVKMLEAKYGDGPLGAASKAMATLGKQVKIQFLREDGSISDAKFLTINESLDLAGKILRKCLSNDDIPL